MIPGDPVAVFEAIHSILTGPGAEESYQYESLGSAAVVKLVRRYIADYRGIFEDSERRAKLVEILQLFSEVGWTDAIKLLYELPDLLRRNGKDARVHGRTDVAMLRELNRFTMDQASVYVYGTNFAHKPLLERQLAKEPAGQRLGFAPPCAFR